VTLLRGHRRSPGERPALTNILSEVRADGLEVALCALDPARDGRAVILFWMILLADTVTMVVMIIEVVRRPLLSSLAMATIAVSAFAAALRQVTAARANALSLPLTFVLVWLLAFRVHGAGWGKGRPRPSTRDCRGQ
jgi:hypothetical protein